MSITERNVEGLRVIGCDVPECPARVETGTSHYDAALDEAEDRGWSINPWGRGTYTYCPDHATEYAGRTPTGRRLSGY